MYKHGIYTEMEPSGYSPAPSGVGTIPVYIGTAPLHLASSVTDKTDKAIKLISYTDAKEKIGYDDDWASYTLCEAIAAHFKNPLGVMGPIYVINVVDPSTHKKSGTATLTFTNSVAYIDKPVILSSFVITDKVLGTDYTLEYLSDNRLKVTKLTTIADSTVATFNEIDVSGIDEDDIVAALPEIDNIYRNNGEVVTIIAAPGWSQIPDVAVAISALCTQKIANKFYARGFVDLDSTSAGSETVDEAIAAIATDGYNLETLKVFWPKFKSTLGEFYGSTLGVWRQQVVDYESDNVPSRTASNKQIPITGTILADSTEIIFNEVKANELNAEGITTANFSGGNWKLWGPHMGNYDYSNIASIDAEKRNDASIRMLDYLGNKLQLDYLDVIDTPLTRRAIEKIIVDVQQWLNSLTNDGHLLFGNIVFLPSNNPDAETTDGNFVFNVGSTTIPNAKSISFTVQYTAQGLTTLFGGE